MLYTSPHPQQDKEYVGFAALPNQLHRKSIKKGFDFTLMVAGLGVLEAVGPQETLAAL